MQFSIIADVGNAQINLGEVRPMTLKFVVSVFNLSVLAIYTQFYTQLSFMNEENVVLLNKAENEMNEFIFLGFWNKQNV